MPVDADSVLIAVPEDTISELVEVGLVHELPALRGPVFDAVVTVGTDSAALVTLLQAPDAVRAFAAWLVAHVQRRTDSITITANRSGRSLRLEVDGDIPVEAVTDFLLAAFRNTADQAAPD